VTLAMDKSADMKDLDLTCASRAVWLVKVGKYPVAVPFSDGYYVILTIFVSMWTKVMFNAGNENVN